MQDLTRGWIRYVKNMGIAKAQSDPNTGKLAYNKQPKVQDLIKYLTNTGDFHKDLIRAAVLQVMQGKSGKGNAEDPETQKQLPGQESETQKQLPNNATDNAKPGENPNNQQSGVSTWHHTEVTPGQRQEPGTDVAQTPQRQPKKSRFNTDDAEDVEVKQPKQQPRLQGNGNAPRLAGPAHPEPEQPPPRKPRFKYRNKIQEAFYDDDGAEVSEDDVEAIFKVLLSQQMPGPKGIDQEEEPKQQQQPQQGQQQGQQQDQTGQQNKMDPAERKKIMLDKLQDIIANDMQPSQRKALWRALHEV
jgi:hypothetical protein